MLWQFQSAEVTNSSHWFVVNNLRIVKLIFTLEMKAVFPPVVPTYGPPVWSSGQSSWLQIQRSGFDSRIFREVVGLERGPLSLVRITEELFQGNSGSGLKNRN
jgi:hypothetical protein